MFLHTVMLNITQIHSFSFFGIYFYYGWCSVLSVFDTTGLTRHKVRICIITKFDLCLLPSQFNLVESRENPL